MLLWRGGTRKLVVSIYLTITLDDVTSLLHLPITGALHTFDSLDVDQATDLLVELLEVNTQEAKDETFQCRGAYVHIAWLQDIYCSKCDARQWTLVARAYTSLWYSWMHTFC